MNMHNKLPDAETSSVYAFPAGTGDTGRASRRGWLKPVLIVLAIVAAGFAAWKIFGPKPAAAPVVANIPEVTVIVPGNTAVAQTVTATGSIAARRDSAVGVQGEGGRVTNVLVEAGQRVAKGQVLVQIDSTVQTQTSRQLAAALRSAQADAQLAESNLKRAQALVGRGFISKADIDQRTASRDGANARVGVASAQLAANEGLINRLSVRAPSDGLILSRTVEAGQIVSPSAILFHLAEGSVLEMRAQVAEQDMAILRPGMTAAVTPVGSTQDYRGRIWLLDPVIDNASRQGIARIALPYSPGLRVGAFAKTRITAGEATRPMLPQSAVQADEKGSYVMVVGAGNKVERRAITVGTVNDQGVAVSTGLIGTEKVVASAAAFLRPGEVIAPVIAKTSA
ncbi:MAG: efflux RND transporter periplasmic adaptor subunit [Sandarakinorhabdus sp.]|nr:efflux RND transporter periplasmic adaptor subunit [Sandarakinorhabdus sp.]